MTGCGAIDKLQKSTADAWAVTYELSVDGGDDPENAMLSDVAYLDQPSRTEERTSVSAGTVTTAGTNGGSATWSVDSILVVGDTAKITATAAEGQRATCRILLDGERALASETGEAGVAVTCSATAPPFDS
ncbi:hypothetical protein ICL81_02580 [Leucobacter sp. cx-328]|uniref:hypothetical protein n=1 Tax=unclassified Leucobacter TaxID=2621730 RepID=UPI00165D5FAA|nr:MULTISPECIES: hypothetical protein [unclassified Leucobacter]MBC9943417.1 hypothetical protein [Leucobacter sp. cx-328]